MDCRICFSIFNKYLRKPIVLLPCCHTFCSNCIVTLKTKSDGILNYPQCRKLINVFKTNYAVLYIIDSNPQNLMEQISRSERVTSDTKEKYFSPNHDHYFETVEPTDKWECCGNKMLGNCRYFTDWLSLNTSPKLDKATICYECKLCSGFIICQSCLEAPKKSPNDYCYSKSHPHRLILSSLDDGWAWALTNVNLI